MGVVRSFLLERLVDEFPAREERLAYWQALRKMLDLDVEPGTGAGQRATG